MEEILDDIIEDGKHEFDLASKGTRFINFFIDRIVVTIFSFGIGIVMALIIISSNGEQAILEYEESLTSTLIEFMIGFIITVTYYVVSEYYFKGKTLGKLLTKTRAVTFDDKRMDLGTVVKRSLSRIVPFEPFSFLGSLPTGWHDQWSGTKVIIDTGWQEEYNF